MAGPDPIPKQKARAAGHGGVEDRTRIYLVVGVLVALAALSVLLAPRGTGVSRCGSALFQQSRDTCIESVAVSTGNSSLCGQLGGLYADQCYQVIAQNTTNASLCGKIGSEAASASCYTSIANATGSVRDCLSIGNSTYADACVYGLAVAGSNSSACSLMGLGNGSQACIASVSLDRALGRRNSSACSGITSNDNSSIAYEAVGHSDLSAYPGVSLNISQAMEYASFLNVTMGARDVCYFALAYQSLTPSDCGEISQGNLSTVCAKSVSYLINSSTAVHANATVNFTALMNQCAAQPQNGQQCRYGVFYIEALQYRNVTYCRSIAAPYSYQCYYGVAQETNNTSYCSYIDNATLNSACIGAVSGLYAVNQS